MSKHPKISILITLLCSIVLAGFSQEQNRIYISPNPDAQFVTTDHNLIFSNGEVLSTSAITETEVRIVGSKSGIHTGSFRLSADRKTLIFEPSKRFSYDETVSVSVKNSIAALNGNGFQVPDFSFSTMEQDNMPLRKKYAEWRAKKESYGNQQLPSGYLKSNTKLPPDLPDDFPAFDITVNNNPGPGYYFITPNNPFGAPDQLAYSIIMDNYGVPVYYKRHNGASADLKIQETGHISHFIPIESGGLGIVYGSHIIYDSHMNVIDTFQMGNGYVAEVHDFQLFNDGSSYLFTYDPQIVDMSEIVAGGDSLATVVGFILQELDTEKNVVFEWSSWDHIDITDAVPFIDLTAPFIDYVHGNAVEKDTDGNIMISFRHTDEIIKIDRQTGDIIWRLNAYYDDLNDFTFTNDTIKFSHQHDIRRLENGNISIFDNGNHHFGPYSRVVEYELDEINMTAELVWAYPAEPDTNHLFAFAMGGAHRQPNGNTAIGWGIGWEHLPILSEVTPDHQIAFELFTLEADSLRTYRAHKFEWETDLFSVSKDSINYGEYTGYTPIPYLLQITNNSDEEISISGTYNRTSEFYVNSNFPLPIEAGATETITVNFAPSGSGNFVDHLTIMCQKDDYEMVAKQVVLTGFSYESTAPEISFEPMDQEVNVPVMPELKITFDEKIYKPSGELITNEDLDDIISFRKENINGEPVDFKACISWYDEQKTELRIIPTDTLDYNAVYFWQVNENTVQDWNANMVEEAVAATFTTQIGPGIAEDEQIDFMSLYPNPVSDKLYLEIDRFEPIRVSVLTIHGMKIHAIDTNSDKITIDLGDQSSGFYFIEVQFEERPSVTLKFLKY